MPWASGSKTTGCHDEAMLSRFQETYLHALHYIGNAGHSRKPCSSSRQIVPPPEGEQRGSCVACLSWCMPFLSLLLVCNPSISLCRVKAPSCSILCLLFLYQVSWNTARSELSMSQSTPARCQEPVIWGFQAHAISNLQHGFQICNAGHQVSPHIQDAQQNEPLGIPFGVHGVRYTF